VNLALNTPYYFRNRTHRDAVLRVVDLAPKLLELTEPEVEVPPELKEETGKELRLLGVQLEEAMQALRVAYESPEAPLAIDPLYHPSLLFDIFDCACILLDQVRGYAKEGSAHRRVELLNHLDVSRHQLALLLAEKKGIRPARRFSNIRFR